MFGISPVGPSWSQACVGDVVECVVVRARHRIINHTQTVRRVLCGFASRQYSIALMCLPEHYIFGMKYVNENTLADLRPDHSEIGYFHYDAVHGQIEGWAFRAGLTHGAHPAENLEKMSAARR